MEGRVSYANGEQRSSSRLMRAALSALFNGRTAKLGAGGLGVSFSSITICVSLSVKRWDKGLNLLLSSYI